MAVALVLGATGLVGRQLTRLLLEDEYWTSVHLFVRRNSGLDHPKLQEHVVVFDRPEQWQHLVRGDVLFSALGTTLAAAGSKAAQYKVDYTYQYQFAQAAAANGVQHYVLVSAANSSLHSIFFYSRMKAELERDVSQLPFTHISILRPGMLAGERQEKRKGEKIALTLASTLHKLPGLSALKPIEGKDVAKAMIVVAKKGTEKTKTYSMQELFSLAAAYGR